MSNKNKVNEPEYHCPACGADHLHVYEETAFVLNTGEFYCHSIKAHDDDAKVICQDDTCNWVGQLKDVKKGI